jgi:hypothetical protein
MLDARGYADAVRSLRMLLRFKLAFWAGGLASAERMMRALRSG